MEEHFERLRQFYADLESRLPLNRLCKRQGTCCRVLLVDLYEIEFEYILAYLRREGRSADYEFVSSRNAPDKRAAFPYWGCPFYSNGCSIHEVRPFACRIYGTYVQKDTEMPCCGFAKPNMYKSLVQVPEAEEYFRVAGAYSYKVGYAVPGSGFSFNLYIDAVIRTTVEQMRRSYLEMLRAELAAASRNPARS
ncbi:MAG: YkgJ family cysteine cluster protein [Armatimonadetes bacterium]|nr:YkgJ family cysteine cluster protein [Armatimonadota bacterium]